MTQQIILKTVKQPKSSNIDDDIRWLCESLGFNQGRDTLGTSSAVINSLLKEIVKRGDVSTRVIADNLDMADQRVNYHIRSLANSGFIYRESKSIHLRDGSVKAAIEEMRLDANRIFDNLSRIAEEIDDSLGLKNR